MTLKYNMPPTWVTARDRKDGYVLLCGLGSLGVGSMWFKDDGSYSNKEGYENAPEQSSIGQMGRYEPHAQGKPDLTHERGKE